MILRIVIHGLTDWAIKARVAKKYKFYRYLIFTTKMVRVRVALKNQLFFTPGQVLTDKI